MGRSKGIAACSGAGGWAGASKAAMSAEDAHILLEVASRCAKRIHQAYVQMAETAFSRDAWEEDRAIKSDWLAALEDVSHFRFLWAPSALRYWSGMEEVDRGELHCPEGEAGCCAG